MMPDEFDMLLLRQIHEQQERQAEARRKVVAVGDRGQLADALFVDIARVLLSWEAGADPKVLCDEQKLREHLAERFGYTKWIESSWSRRSTPDTDQAVLLAKIKCFQNLILDWIEAAQARQGGE